MKRGFLADVLSSSRNAPRKRARTAPFSSRRQAAATSATAAALSPAKPGAHAGLIIVESEGAAFDSLRHRAVEGYMPAFSGCFAWGADPALCVRIWQALSLESRLRGEDPALCLVAALRLLNAQLPSLRRAAVVRAVESCLASNPHYDFLATPQDAQATPQDAQATPHEAQAGAPGDGAPLEPPARAVGALVADWMMMAEGLLREAGAPDVFSGAKRFLQKIAADYPEADVLVHSRLSEAQALYQWEMAGLGGCFMRIAGRERGDMIDYLRSALAAGYDRVPIVVIGSSRASWLAAQAACARFFPVVPGEEEASWQRLVDYIDEGRPCVDFSKVPRGDFSSFLEKACGEPACMTSSFMGH